MTGKCWSSAGTATCLTAWGPSMPPGSASFTAAGQPLLLLLRNLQALSYRSAILGPMAACWYAHCVLLAVLVWHNLHWVMQARSVSQ